jgi:hypothetical protein
MLFLQLLLSEGNIKTLLWQTEKLLNLLRPQAR